MQNEPGGWGRLILGAEVEIGEADLAAGTGFQRSACKAAGETQGTHLQHAPRSVPALSFAPGSSNKPPAVP